MTEKKDFEFREAFELIGNIMDIIKESESNIEGDGEYYNVLDYCRNLLIFKEVVLAEQRLRVEQEQEYLDALQKKLTLNITSEAHSD